MCKLAASNSGRSLMCLSAWYGNPGHKPGSSWSVARRQSGTAVVPQYEDRSLSAGPACMVLAGGMAAERPPLDGFIAVASKAHE